MELALAIHRGHRQVDPGVEPDVDPGGEPDVDPGGDPDPGDGGGGNPQELVYPSYDVLIATGDNAANIVNNGSAGTVYCFEAGIHDATQWTDYLKPKSGDVLTGPTLGGALLQDGVETGRCAAVIRGSRDISGLNWQKQPGRNAWSAVFSSLPAALPVNLVAIYRENETIPPENVRKGWLRRVADDNPPRAAGYAEEIFMAAPAPAASSVAQGVYFRPIETAARCQRQDSANQVDGTRTYGGDTAGADDWHLFRSVTTAHINQASKTLTVGQNPQNMVVTLSCRLGHNGKAVGGSANNVTIRNLHFTQFPSDIQNGPVQPGGYRYDTDNKGFNWTIEDCHFSNHHGAAVSVQTGWHIKGCIFEKMGQIGLRSGYQDGDARIHTSNFIFEQNIVRNNGGSLCYGWNTELGGFKFTHANAHIARNNWIHDNIGSGMWWDVDCNQTIGAPTSSNQIVISENLSERNFYGLHYELCFGHVHITRNLFRDNGGFERHGNPFGFSFRTTAQVRIGVSSRSNNGSKPILVDHNVAAIHRNAGYNAGTGGGGHNSHGIMVYVDRRGTSANVRVVENDIIFATHNNGAQRSLIGCYSASNDVSTADLTTMNATLAFANNNIFYSGGVNDHIFVYSDTPSDLGTESRNSFQAKRSAFHSNSIINDLRRPVFTGRCPPVGFDPKTLNRS